MAKELRGRSITVNTVAPGPTAKQLFLDGKPQEVVDRMSKMAPLERLGTPQDIANVVAFLGEWAKLGGHRVRVRLLERGGVDHGCANCCRNDI